jgi:hypothetical protein
MGRNYRVTVRRICAVVGVVMVFAWGIPALAPAPAALASPVVASAATRSTPPQAHPRDAQVPLDAPLCLKLLEANEYIITSKMTLGCNAGAQTYPGPPPYLTSHCTWRLLRLALVGWRRSRYYDSRLFGCESPGIPEQHTMVRSQRLPECMGRRPVGGCLYGRARDR